MVNGIVVLYHLEIHKTFQQSLLDVARKHWSAENYLKRCFQKKKFDQRKPSLNVPWYAKFLIPLDLFEEVLHCLLFIPARNFHVFLIPPPSYFQRLGLHC